MPKYDNRIEILATHEHNQGFKAAKLTMLEALDEQLTNPNPVEMSYILSGFTSEQLIQVKRFIDSFYLARKLTP